MGKNEEWERRKAVLIGKRFNVAPMSNIKSHFVTIDSGVVHGVMREISPEFNVNREEFSGEKPGDALEEYLRFQTSESEQAKVVH